MSNKKYFWLKLKEDFFEEKQIRYLRKLPDGDKLVIVYLKMQLKSLKTEGVIKYDQILPSNEDELAMILEEDVNIVKLLLQALLQVKAIEILDDGSFFMIAMQELIGKEGQSAERMRKLRERQKMLASHCDTNVIKSDTEIEKEKEKEIDVEKEKTTTKENSINFYENNFGLITPVIADKINSYLEDGIEEDLIIVAMQKAVDNNVRKWSYVQTILNDCLNNNIKTLHDFEIQQNEYKNKKTTKTTTTKKEVEYNTDFSEYDKYAGRN